MKEFDITITETLKKTVTVRAEDSEQAMDLVHDQHSQGVHVLDADDFDDMTIETAAERDIILTVLLVEPMKPPQTVEIPDTLEALQAKVEGNIEGLYPYDDPVGIVCNEEGKIGGLPLNRAIYDERGEMIEIIAGNFLVVGLGEENFDTLPPELMEKYSKLFEKPERFFNLAGTIIAQKIELSGDRDTTKKTAETER